MKVNNQPIRETLEEYDKRPVSKSIFSNLPTKEINGLVFHVSNMSTEEFCKKYKLKSIDDVNWS